MTEGDRSRYGARGPYPWVGGPPMSPAELEAVAARYGLTMAEVDERCDPIDPQDCEDFRDWWARMAEIRNCWGADRRRGYSGGHEHSARHILKAAEIYGIRGLADEAMEVIAAELRRPSRRARRQEDRRAESDLFGPPSPGPSRKPRTAIRGKREERRGAEAAEIPSPPRGRGSG